MLVFLCHASEDKPAVRCLHDRLVADGFETWFDQVSLKGGQDWRREIRRTVPEADAVVVFLSKHSVSKKGFVQAEIRLALEAAQNEPEGSIYVIPVRIEPCELPRSLERWHCIDLFEPSGYDRLLESLSDKAIHRKLPQARAQLRAAALSAMLSSMEETRGAYSPEIETQLSEMQDEARNLRTNPSSERLAMI